jgi:hypothetical protein
MLEFLGMALTGAVSSLTELTEYAEDNQKHSVISAGSARERVSMYD